MTSVPALAPRIRSFLKPCTCHCRYASASATSPDRLVAAAKRLIDATSASSVNIGKGKRREMDSIARAVQDVEQSQELIATLEAMSNSSTEDPELRSLARSDLPDARTSLESQRSSLLTMLLPAPPSSNMSAMVEVKPGVGGSESTLWMGDLVRMYTRLASRKGWQVDTVQQEEKEVLLEIKGEGAFKLLRWEAGVHRVQRIPVTEEKGRVHTSTAAVIVLPVEQEGTESDNDVILFDLKDVKIEVMRSRGAGGQHVNRTESAVRLTHAPTGVTVSMQDSRSQRENRDKAFRVLRARLLDRKIAAEQDLRRATRKGQVKNADRGEKIRTYSWGQGRITDHRIGESLSSLEEFMSGGESIELFWNELEAWERDSQLESLLEGD